MINDTILNNITICAVVGHEKGLLPTISAMEYSIKDIPFIHTQILSCQRFEHERIKCIPIPKMTYPEYNNFIIRDYSHYINTDFVITIQDDGFIINPEAWTDKFLNYDYIGALWPVGIGDGNPNRKVKTPEGKMIRVPNVTRLDRCGNGGFTLRSKKFLDISQQFCPVLDYNEDAVVCRIYRDLFLSHNIRYATDEIASKFSIEFDVPETLILGQRANQRHTLKTFGFHGKHCDAINFIRT